MFENCKKKNSVAGYDLSFKDPDTQEIVEIGVNAIIEGKSRNTIAKLLVLELGLKGKYAQTLATHMWKESMAKGKDRREGLPERNIVRLEHIYHKAMENNDLKNAINAIDLLNKLSSAYKSQVEITTDDFEFQIGNTKQNAEKDTNTENTDTENQQ